MEEEDPETETSRRFRTSRLSIQKKRCGATRLLEVFARRFSGSSSIFFLISFLS
jgi:hypothetical protein